MSYQWLWFFGLAGVLAVAGASCTAFSSGNSATTILPAAAGEAGRWVILDGANNTRDIGGYRTQDGRQVRWGTVYRSGQLTDLTPTGCGTFQDLGVRTVVDFRNRLMPSPLFGGDAACVFTSARMYVLPVSAAKAARGVPAYVQKVRDSGNSYRQTFELLANRDNLPLMYHCAGGKDRTGIMTALLMTMLGVDRQAVMADFALSDQVGATTNPRVMADLLDEVDRQGGIETYLVNIGVSARTQSTLRSLLLEPVDSAGKQTELAAVSPRPSPLGTSPAHAVPGNAP